MRNKKHINALILILFYQCQGGLHHQASTGFRDHLFCFGLDIQRSQSSKVDLAEVRECRLLTSILAKIHSDIF